MFNKKWYLIVFLCVTHLVSVFLGVIVSNKITLTPKLEQKDEKIVFSSRKEKIYAGVVLPPNLVTGDYSKDMDTVRKFLSQNNEWSHISSGKVPTLEGQGFALECSICIPENENKLAKK